MNNIFFKTRSEDIPYLYNLVENYFQAINARVNNTNVKHQSSIVSRTDEIEMVNEIAPKILKNKPFKGLSFQNAAMIIFRALRSRNIAKKTILFYSDRKQVKESELYKKKMKELEEKALKLSPEVEGRSVLIENQMVYISIYYVLFNIYNNYITNI